MRIQNYTILFLALLISISGFSQKQSIVTKHFVKERTVLIRWAPSDKSMFESGVNNGYKITRYLKKGSTVSEPVVIAEQIKPLQRSDSAKWNALIRKNSNAALAFNLLYENNPKNSPQKEKQQQMLYNLMLLSCDHDAEIAKACGLFLTDSTATNTSTYQYKIEINNPPQAIKISSATIDVNTTELSLNPPLNALYGKFKNKTVQLSWSTAGLTGYYGGYDIERSTDSLDYRKINKAPVILLSSQFEKNKSEITFLDTVQETGIRYFYRIRGISFFGERSAPSNVVAGTGFEPINSSPVIDSIKAIENKKVFIRWKMSNEKENALPKKYVLMRSERDNGKYSILFESKDVFNYTDNTPLRSNYYKIGAITPHNDTLFSFSSLALIADTIPPAPPSGLKATVDTKGNVDISWNKNPESDVQGYKIYKANALTEEFVQINNEFAKDPSYQDKLNLKTLSRKIYYSVVATDNNYNSSELSAPIEVKRPDTIAPAAPIINDLKISRNGIKISWIPSSSEDVKQYVLFHQEEKSNTETQLKNWTKTDTAFSFTDTLTEMGNGYRYKIIAMDEDDNFSISNIPYMLYETGFRKKINDINAVADRSKKLITLTWSYPEKEVEKYIIYRANAKVPLTIIKTLTSPSSSFEDNTLSIGNTYEYRIKAVFSNGAESIISDAVIIEY